MYDIEDGNQYRDRVVQLEKQELDKSKFNSVINKFRFRNR